MDPREQELRDHIKSHHKSVGDSRDLAEYLKNEKNYEIVVKIGCNLIMKHEYIDFQVLSSFLWDNPQLNHLLVSIVNNLLIRFDVESKDTEIMHFILEMIYLRRDLFHQQYYEILFSEFARFACCHVKKLSKSPREIGYLFTCINQLISLTLENPTQFENTFWYQNSLELVLQSFRNKVSVETLQESQYLFFEYALAFINHAGNSNLQPLLLEYLDDLIKIATNGGFTRCTPILTHYFNSLDVQLVSIKTRRKIFRFFNTFILNNTTNTLYFYQLIESLERVLLATAHLDGNSQLFNRGFCLDSLQSISLQITTSSQTECSKRLVTLIYNAHGSNFKS